MWTCPKCQHKFYNKNQAHSCGSYTVDGFLAGKTGHAQDLFHAFINAYKEIGPFELHPVKTRVALLTKMRFASINKLGKDHLQVHLVLTEHHEEPALFYRVENLLDRFFVHNFRLYTKDDIDATLKKYMKLAYKIGEREHVKK